MERAALPSPSRILALPYILLLFKIYRSLSAECSEIPYSTILYKLPSDFNVTCGQLPLLNTSQLSKASALFTPILISKERSFAWGLLTSGREASPSVPVCSLSIVCFSCKTYYVVWSACCDEQGEAFSSARTLILGNQRNLRLLDNEGFGLWSTATQNVESIELLETGNLLFFDSRNTIIWQSFNYPSNTLLPGQILTAGMALTAGKYSISMASGGLGFYVKVLNTRLPYLVLNSTWGLSDIRALAKPLCSVSSLVYTSDGSSLIMEIDTDNKASPCYNVSSENTISRFNQTISSNQSNNKSGGFRFLRLDDNGELRTYADDDVDFSWFNQGNGSEGKDYCGLPDYCGNFGICEPRGHCACANTSMSKTLNHPTFEDYILEKPDVSGCPQMHDVNCSSIDFVYQMFTLQDLDYFPHRYMPLSGSKFSMQECLESCKQNCSCSVAFYNNLSSVCHQYDKILSMQRMRNGSNHLVFIKISQQMNSTENHLQPHAFANHRLNFIAVAIIFGVSLIVCLVVFLWVYKHYGSWNDEMDAHDGSRSIDDDAVLGSLSRLPPRYTYKELQQITRGFAVKLGQGSFGSVYEGTLDDGGKIAVKRLEGTRQGDKEFRAEVASLAGISHVNLVKLIGFCAEKGHRMLIYDYMTNGSLDRWLARGDEDRANLLSGGLEWKQRLSIAIDAARGLSYLHGESRERIFHFDVKPQNILLDENFVAKLSDFGLSKRLDRARSRTMTSMRGTPGYLAPEWLLQAAVSDKSDVYSFGMVLLELISGRRNVDHSGVKQENWFWPAWVVNKVVSGLWLDIRMELSSRAWPAQNIPEGERAIKVALWCLQEDPKSRPTMSTVLRMLEGLVHVADPPLEMRLTLEAQARLLASCNSRHCFPSADASAGPDTPLTSKSSSKDLNMPTTSPHDVSTPSSPCSN
ncbi:hypothetical protein KP509_15G020300 [Ceratopteris richardii]|uniref:non-specific serine/threonine protein kinase n=1 Tax=Ceratopteris richardii TaxID=49495 RepID=A0A8T2T680_CERRI|nr:hypothetical protein KP509_15G020300 [Ceratopteris richardii]